MNRKYSFRYISILMVLTSIWAFSCKTKKVSKSLDFSFLNGSWIQRCDSILVGDYQGEMECVLLDDETVVHNLTIMGNQGFMIRESSRTKDTMYLVFKYNEKDRLMLEFNDKNRKWLEGVHQADSSHLKLYAQDSSAIKFYKRKK